VVAAALAIISTGLIVFFIYGVFLIVRSFVVQFQNVLLPVAIAAILATLLQPIVDFFQKRLRMSRIGSIIVLFVLVFGLLLVGMIYAVPALLQQLLSFLEFLPRFGERVITFLEGQMPSAVSWMNERFEGQSFRENLQRFLLENSATIRTALMQVLFTLGSTGNYLMGLLALMAAYAVVPIYLFYLLRKESSGWEILEKQLQFLRPNVREDVVFLARHFVDILISFFRRQILVGMITAVMYVIGVSAIGLRFALLFGVLIGLANIVPYLGTIIGITLVLPVAFFQVDGGWLLALLATVVFFAVQNISDYLILPRIMGDKTGMGPMLIIFSIFFWGTALGGIMGMVLAIPLTAFFLVFWLLVRDKYLPKWAEQGGGTKPEV
jgi:predicted PurR-regulated permease PerM